VVSSDWIDGIPLDLARRLAVKKFWWRPGFLTHIWLHSKAQERFQQSPPPPSHPPRLSRTSLTRIIDSLGATIGRCTWDPEKTQWAHYYSTTTYSEEAMETKRRFVASVIEETKPTRVVDLGANTGEFSEIAARAGAYVIAADLDHGAVELCFRRTVVNGNQSILPLVVDVTSPTPGIGWMNVERTSFLERCAGTTDLVLALALLHHLVIGSNIPIRNVVQLLARIGPNVILEFIDKRDSQAQRLLASREDIFGEYSASGLEAALVGVFRIVRKQPLDGTHRVMYHARRI
jgi:ribosomal protein L11 methylase PrmA